MGFKKSYVLLSIKVCPLDAKKNTCPVGYECIPSRKGGINVCCSKLEHQTPECVVGHAFFDAGQSQFEICSLKHFPITLKTIPTAPYEA